MLDKGTRQNVGFGSETELVDRVIRFLKRRESPWGRVQTLTEWDYRSGITDILARTRHREVIAFEAKLTDWRRAIHQAYRNTTFALRSYVVLPDQVARRAEGSTDLFTSHGVGLCACAARGLSILIEARESDPLMEWLTRRAHATFDGLINVTRTAGSGGLRQSPLPAA